MNQCIALTENAEVKDGHVYISIELNPTCIYGKELYDVMLSC